MNIDEKDIPDLVARHKFRQAWKDLETAFPVISDLIHEERVRQIEKWGDEVLPADAYCRILGEEFGEVCRAVDKKDWDNCHNELIQVAAVCVRMIQALDRKDPDNGEDLA